MPVYKLHLPAFKSLLLLLKAMVIIISVPAVAAPPPILVSSIELSKIMNQQPNEVVVIDLRSASDYQNAHIPRAIHLPLNKLHREKNGIQGFVISPLKFQTLISRIGIKNHQHLVFYAGDNILEATRAFWIFDFYGHEKISILDGGFLAWVHSNQALSEVPFSLKPSNYTVSIQPEILASKFDIHTASLLRHAQIIDARPENEYQGLDSKSIRKGHIPNASNIPWSKFVKQTSGTFELLTPNELQTFFKHQISPDKPTILYCNDGTEASLIYFSLRTLGYKSSLYDGSWNEWSSDSNLPIINQAGQIDSNHDITP